jgi:hypothetical protein
MGLLLLGVSTDRGDTWFRPRVFVEGVNAD